MFCVVGRCVLLINASTNVVASSRARASMCSELGLPSWEVSPEAMVVHLLLNVFTVLSIFSTPN